MIELVWVGIGGFFGAIARFWISASISLILIRQTSVNFPYGTIFVNVTGSFLLGFFLSLSQIDRQIALMIGTGFFGAYTTYSTFAVETNIMFRQGRMFLAGINIIATTLLSILGAFAGAFIAHQVI